MRRSFALAIFVRAICIVICLSISISISLVLFTRPSREQPLARRAKPFNSSTLCLLGHFFPRNSLGRARGFFHDLGSWLMPGGCFVATTVDARVMVELLMSEVS